MPRPTIWETAAVPQSPTISNPFEICHRCDQRQRPCAGPCSCNADPQRRDIIELVQIGRCPLGKFGGKPSLAQPELAPRKAAIEMEGPKLWAKFHLWTLRGDPESGPLAWLALFREELRRAAAGCSCLDRWDKILSAHPLPIEQKDHFGWGVDRHNDVNRELGKPIITVEAALKRWN